MSKASFRASGTQQGLIENMQILTGQKGDQLDKALTIRDAASLGIVNLRRNSSGNVVPEVPSNPSDPVWSGVQAPHAPADVSADGAFHTISITWDPPTYQGHSYAEILRAETDNPAQAVPIGETSANVYSDAVGKGFEAYYWVRFVNKNGLRGPFQSSSGLHAKTSPDVDEIIASATNFAIYNPAKPTEKEIIFGVTDDGKVAILEAVIKAATIQIIHAEKITADYVKAGVSISAPVINGGSIAIGNNFAVTADGAMTAWSATLRYVTSYYGTFNYATINQATMRNCVIEEDCIVKGVVYADKIVGGVITERDFLTSEYSLETGDAWASVLSVNIDKASKQLRRLRLQGPSITVVVSAPPDNTMSYTVRYRIVYNNSVLKEGSVSASAAGGMGGDSSSRSVRIDDLIPIAATSTGSVKLQVLFPTFNVGAGSSMAKYSGGVVTARLFIDSEEMS